MARRKNIGQAEMEVLQYIIEHHPVTVREVAGHFADTKGHVRTTVLNVMQRLCEKGYLIRRKREGVFQYEPRESKGQLLRSLVKDFVDRSLGGSLSPFVAYLAEQSQLSEADLTHLQRIVQELETQGQNSDAAKEGRR